MIYITGDTHGLIDFQKLKTYFRHRYVSKNDILIILGDAGIVWSETDCSLFDYETLGPTVFFIDGNHENFTLLNRFPVVERFGAKVHYLSHDIFHVFRGEILKINGKSFLCLGGATSIDKEYRVPGISWWAEEHICDEDIDNALKNIEKSGGKVDYILTHCAPSPIVRSMFGYASDSDTDKLSKLQGSIAYDSWYFGHYHADHTRGRFRCFYNDILEIPAMKTGKRHIHQHLLIREYDAASPYLYHWKTGRKTNLTKEDLPEWYLEDFAYRHWFYDLSGVKDVAFHRPIFDNHISKDARIYLSYSGKHPKNKDLSPTNEKEWDVETWRADITEVVLGLEKYSPGLNLNPIKAQINLTYDQYNNGSMYSFGNSIHCRPFPYVKTPRYKDRWKGDVAQFAVYHGSKILSTFIDKGRAIEYAENYITHNLRISLLQYTENKEGARLRTYDTGHDISQWVRIETIDPEGGVS